jgi:hypothetical protein
MNYVSLAAFAATTGAFFGVSSPAWPNNVNWYIRLLPESLPCRGKPVSATAVTRNEEEEEEKCPSVFFSSA